MYNTQSNNSDKERSQLRKATNTDQMQQLLPVSLLIMQSNSFRKFSSFFAPIIVAGFLWTRLEGKPLGVENSLQTFNKTVRDELMRQSWLRILEQRVNRNGSRPSPKFKPKAPALSRQPKFPNTRLLNFTGRDNLPDPTDIVAHDEKPRLPVVVVWSNAIEKNVLSFKLSRDNFSKRNLVTSFNLYVFIRRRKSKRKKSKSPQAISPSKSRSSMSARDLKSRKRQRKRRNRVIKIRVYSVDQRGARGRKIAELKKRVTSSDWQRIGLPVYLLKSVSDAPANSTLRLRVECRRCTRKTQLVLPGNWKGRRCQRKGRSKGKDRKSRKASRKKGQRNRKKCSPVSAVDEAGKKPFIVIEDKPRHSRRKRSSLGAPESKCLGDSRNIPGEFSQKSRQFHNRTRTQKTAKRSCCKMFTTYINFSELNLENRIVYPMGFSLVSCVGTCERETLRSSSRRHSSSRKSHSNTPHRPLNRNKLRDRNAHSQRLKSSSRVHSLGDRKNNISSGDRKKNRLKNRKFCVPTKTTGLNIIYLAHDNNLYQTEIPNVLISECGCKDHRQVTNT